MFIRRVALCAGLLSAMPLARPAMATDDESGLLSCPAGKVGRILNGQEGGEEERLS